MNREPIKPQWVGDLVKTVNTLHKQICLSQEAEASKELSALDDESALSSKLEATRLKGDVDIENPIGGLSNDEVKSSNIGISLWYSI